MRTQASEKVGQLSCLEIDLNTRSSNSHSAADTIYSFDIIGPNPAPAVARFTKKSGSVTPRVKNSLLQKCPGDLSSQMSGWPQWFPTFMAVARRVHLFHGTPVTVWRAAAHPLASAALPYQN